MNNDEQFEQRLQHQPARKIPADWREEILSTAVAAVYDRRTLETYSAAITDRRYKPSLSRILASIFWPSPRAWVGLAAVWIVIFVANLSTRDDSPNVAKNSSPLTPEMRMVLQQQKMMLAELIEPRETPLVEPPKSDPQKPHSERRDGFVIG